ncbi:MAG: redoxin domain-containing protein [Desulfobacterota bacterium]|nr:redoxin domain-containing protein [Thermodesulfobacteriota bacterium]
MQNSLFFIILFLASLIMPHTGLCLEPGDIAKDFALRDKYGNVLTLNNLRAGFNVTVLEFISIYCDVCKKKTPKLNALLKKYGSEKIKIIAVALANNQPEIEAETAPWGVQFPILPDPDKLTLHLYGFHKVPQMYIIDNAGIIRYSGNGDNMKEVELIIDALMHGDSLQCRAGDNAPEIVLYDYAGQKIQIDFSRSNAGTVLGFFSSDDRKHCRQADVLNKLSRQAHDIPFSLYAIAAYPFDGELNKIIQKLGDNVPVLIDSGKKIFKRYCVEKAPELVIVSGSGRIRMRNAPCDVEKLLWYFEKPSTPSRESAQEQLSQALRRAMPEAQSIKPISIGDTVVHVGIFPDGSKSYARIVTKDILCEVCTDVSFVQVIDQEGMYRTFELIRPFESCGKKIDATDFLRQFIGKSYHQPFVAGANADTISGATKSCLKFIEALNENEELFSSFLDDPSFDASFRRSVCFLEQAEIEHAIVLYSQHHKKIPHNIQEVTPYCRDGVLPQCPAGGTYIITTFNDIARVLCTVHGLDPESSMIH